MKDLKKYKQISMNRMSSKTTNHQAMNNNGNGGGHTNMLASNIEPLISSKDAINMKKMASNHKQQ